MFNAVDNVTSNHAEDSYIYTTWRGIASDSTGQQLCVVGYSFILIHISSVTGGTSSSSVSQQTNTIHAFDTIQWTAVTSDGSGKCLVAVGSNVNIYTSQDSGGSWIEQPHSGARDWWDVSSSNSGNRVVAVVHDGGYIYTSDDFGVSWMERTQCGKNSWQAVAMDETGLYIAAVAKHGYIYTSSDNGISWLPRAKAQDWRGIALDDTGRYAVAVVFNGGVWGSQDYGVSWSYRSGSYIGYYTDVCSDGTGVFLAAVTNGGYIYTSADRGESWSEQRSAEKRLWWSVTSGGTGEQLAAIELDDSLMYLSNDYGADWSAVVLVDGAPSMHPSSPPKAVAAPDNLLFISIFVPAVAFLLLLIAAYYCRGQFNSFTASDPDDVREVEIPPLLEAREEVDNIILSAVSYQTDDALLGEYPISNMITSRSRFNG